MRQEASAREKCRTLGSLVRPETGHSLTSAGASSEVKLAFSTNGSLMMFTVKFFVALMLLAVSFRPPLGLAEHDTEMVGGLCVTWLNQLQIARGGAKQGTLDANVEYGDDARQ